jgi:hypothetical protein
VSTAAQTFPPAFVTFTGDAAGLPPTVKEIDGAGIVSLAVNERVTVSPVFAISSVPLLAALLESIETIVSVGGGGWIRFSGAPPASAVKRIMKMAAIRSPIDRETLMIFSLRNKGVADGGSD